MTELATGAVSSLLVVIRNEALLLGGVHDDVQFIKEEMESMNSFLAHLARSAPPGGDHDEQVRTWMNQVRLLAQDCNNCIDLYLYSGNPDIHRAKSRLRRYLWWAYWFLRKMVAQHRAAVQLRQLKDRARDVGERRLRYGVEVPDKLAAAAGRLLPAAGTTPPLSSASAKHAAPAAAAVDDEEDPEDQLMVATATHHQSSRRAVFEPRTLDGYVKAKLLEWLYELPENSGQTWSIGIVAPDAHKNVLALAHETLVVPSRKDVEILLARHRETIKHFSVTAHNLRFYDRVIMVNIPAVHLDFFPLRPKEVLYYILRELEHPESPSHKQGPDLGEENENFHLWQEDYYRKWGIYHEKKCLLIKIKDKIKKMEIYGKLDKIKSDIKLRQEKREDHLLLHLDPGEKKDMDQMGLDVLLHMLLLYQQDQVKNKDMHKLLIMKIAKNLKKKMEEDENDTKPEKEGAEEEREEEQQQQKNKEAKGDKKGGGHETIDEEEEDNKNGGGEDERNKEEKEDNQKGGDERKAREGEAEGREGGEEKDDDVNSVEEYYDTKEEEDEHIFLNEDQYAQILRQVFPKTSSSKPPWSQQEDRSKTPMAMFDVERIKQMIQEVLTEQQEGKSNKNQGTGESSAQGQNQKVGFEEIAQKIEEIKHELKRQLKMKGIVDKIKHHLKKDCPLIILKVDDMMDGSRWEEIRKALNMLESKADALIITTTKSIQQAEGYCYPPREPIDYSLVGLYHDTVLQLTSQQENEDSQEKNEDNYNPQVFRSILEDCVPHEFCMKIFTHALYANPKRSNEELVNLHGTLKASPKSFDIISKKMFMYSYKDLPKEYRSCLLYLAIFRKGQKIRRSTLIERWVVEGLTLKEDWPSSVHHANRCFDALIRRWLVYPADISSTGKVKSCVIGDPVHGFITIIARKQHFVETRLSHHLARHFSIFNDLQLRSSDRIVIFFQGLSKSSRVSLLKVLDLEGCQCFDGKNQRYLKDICSKMLLLKYLSLRNTGITQLPSEINLLRDLEVLDIRQTMVPEHATRNILLLKLKRLLAGCIGLYPSNSATSVRIPRRIEKMVNIEVLSNVKARHSHDLKYIGNLWQLRKLGMVIDKDHHLSHLLQAISDLHECLRSLSITLPAATPDGCTASASRVELPASIGSGFVRFHQMHSATQRPQCSLEGRADRDDSDEQRAVRSLLQLQNQPKILESLSISGTILKGSLLSVITKSADNKLANKLAKVTLTSTPINQDDLTILAKLPVLQCLRLRHIARAACMLTFKKDEFICLKYFLIEVIENSNTSESPSTSRMDQPPPSITFEDGSALELEKMVLSFTGTWSVSGVDRLPKLEELELNKSFGSMLPSSFGNARQIAKVTLSGKSLEQGALQNLAKIPNIRCLVLLLDDKPSGGTQEEIAFNADEFMCLRELVIDSSSITKIIFTSGSVPRLEKIVWSSFKSFAGIECLSGINELPRLKELEFNGDLVPTEVEKAIQNHKNKPSCKHYKPETQDQAGAEEGYDDGATKFSCC